MNILDYLFSNITIYYYEKRYIIMRRNCNLNLKVILIGMFLCNRECNHKYYELNFMSKTPIKVFVPNEILSVRVFSYKIAYNHIHQIKGG